MSGRPQGKGKPTTMPALMESDVSPRPAETDPALHRAADGPVTSESGFENERWTVVFYLSARLDDDSQEEVLKRIEYSAAFVDQPRQRQALSIGVYGPMDEALATAYTAARNALEGHGDPEIEEARMVPHRDVRKHVVDAEPINYYSVTECAKVLGVTRQRVQQLLKDDKLPPPDACVGGKAVWDARAFDAFAWDRIRKVRSTPLGLDPSKPRPAGAG